MIRDLIVAVLAIVMCLSMANPQAVGWWAAKIADAYHAHRYELMSERR